MHNKRLLDEYNSFTKKLYNGHNIMLLRFGDGERAIMTGKSVKAQEGWCSPNSITKLGHDLLSTLSIDEDSVYFGISCPCCDIDAYRWYIKHIQSKNITFANMFVNINYRQFITDFEKIKRDAIVIGNSEGINHRIGNLNVLHYYSVGNQCVEFWEKEGQALVEKIINEY